MEDRELRCMAPGTKIFVNGRHGVESAVFERMATRRAHITIRNAKWTFSPHHIIGIDDGTGEIPEVKRMEIPNDLQEGDIILLAKGSSKEYMRFIEYNYSSGHIIVEDGNGKRWRYKMAGSGFFGLVAKAIPENTEEETDSADDEHLNFKADAKSGILTEA